MKWKCHQKNFDKILLTCVRLFRVKIEITGWKLVCFHWTSEYDSVTKNRFFNFYAIHWTWLQRIKARYFLFQNKIRLREKTMVSNLMTDMLIGFYLFCILEITQSIRRKYKKKIIRQIRLEDCLDHVQNKKKKRSCKISIIH